MLTAVMTGNSQAGKVGRKNRLYKKEDRQAGAGRQERLAGKIGCIRRKTSRLGQAGRKGLQER
jgi:hypothetical protein